MSNIRIQDGLVLVPYPLHLVTELTVDDLDPDLNLGRFNHEYPPDMLLGDYLRFLETIPGSRVHTLRLYTNSGQTTSTFYSLLTHHFDHICHFDWAFVNGCHYCPHFTKHTRTIRVLHDRGSDRDSDFHSVISKLPNLVRFDEQGYGDIGFRSVAAFASCSINPLFTSSVLAWLVLDFALSSWTWVDGPFPIHTPALTSLVLSCQIAAEWFTPNWLETLFARIPSPSSSTLDLPSYAFPALTHFTLTDLPDQPDNGPDGHSIALPKLPLAHMPNLTHFSIPFGYKGRRVTHYLTPDEMTQLGQLAHLESLCIPSVDCILFNGPARRRPKQVFSSTVTHVEIQFDLFKDLHLHATFPGLTSLTLHKSRKTKSDLFYGTPVLGRHYSHLTRLTLHLAKFNHFTWPRFLRQVPSLKHLAIHATRNSHKNSTTALATWTPDAPLEFVHLESLELHMAARAHVFELDGLAFPNLRSMHLVSGLPRLDPVRTLIPRLQRLVVGRGTHGGYVVPGMVELVTHPLLCPSVGVKFVRVDNVDDTDRGMRLVSAKSLTMHFTGSFENRKSWRALIGREMGGGGYPVRLGPGAVKESVVVKVARLPYGKQDATLVAATLAQLLADLEPRSVALEVRPFGLLATAKDVELVKTTIDELKITCLSTVSVDLSYLCV